MDLNTIEGSLSFAQLLTKFRETYKKIKKNAIMAKKTKGTEKIEHLEELFTYIRFSEAIIKRLNTLAIQDTMAAAQNLNSQIKALNITDQKQIKQIENIYDRLLRLLEKVDRDNLIENRKSGNLVWFDRGAIKQIKAIKYDSGRVASARLKAANDELYRQNYKKAA